MLTGDSRFDVVIAGRDLSKAEAFCEQHGGRPLQLDRQGDQFGTVTADLSPFIVVDAAGPFQAYGNSPYSVAEAALSVGAHYLDFSDDAAFTAGISLLDDKARTRGLVALSGVSSVPALSSAAVAELTDGLTDIHLIESAILPGNRAPRGLSVVRSILGQAGRPLELWRGNHWTTAKGWGDNRPVDIGIAGTAPLRSRWASLIGAPDLVLFPTQYRARSVIFRAGLELKLMHGGLALLSRLVRWRLLNSLEPLAPTLKWTAERLERFGTDRGGMLVRVIARQADTRLVSRCWKLIVEAGDGPSIPAIPARVLCEKLADDSVSPGARACLAEFSLRDAERAMSTLSIRTGRGEAAASVLFPDAVGQEDFDRLPGGVQDLHCLVDRRDWSGRASITRGRGLLSRVAAWFAGFPPAGDDVPV